MVLRSSKGSFGSFDSLDNIRDIYSSMPSVPSSSGNSVHDLQPVQDAKTEEYFDGREPTWRSLFNFTTRRHIPHIIFTMTLTILSSCLKPAGAVLYGKSFAVLTRFGAGQLSPSETVHEMAKWCTALVILGVVSWFVELGFLSTWMAFGELQAVSVRKEMFASMLGKDMDWYDLRHDGIGSLLIRIETQIRELQLSVSQPLGFCVYEISVSIVALGLGFYYTWQLTLVILATLPILGLVLFFVSKRLAPAIEAQKRELSLGSKFTNTAIANVNTVKAYNGQDHEIWQYYTTVKRVAGSYVVQARANALQFGIIKCATVGLFVQGFWFGLVLVNHGLDPARVFTTYYACLIAMQSIEIVLPQWLVLAKGKSAGHTLSAIIKGLQRDQGRKVTRMEGSLAPKECSGDIEIKNVSFSYPSNPEQPAMKGVNFFFPANETTYLVGRSGSGKSTVGNLLMKYYEINQGEILIDGNSIQTLNLDWLRENITLVQQQSVLFNETILQNIAFGKKSPVSEEEILNAIQTADLQQTIDDMPDGLNTVIGSAGKSLSGGQQQRIAIARARIRDSAILILDEATSALDQKSRATVTGKIREWRQGKTTIIITHDVSRILDDEYVYVLEHGIIVQEGYCKKLAEKKNGTFASFLPPEVPDTPSSPRRKSEPLSPTTPVLETGLPDFEELHAERGFMSRLLGPQEQSDSRSWRQSFGIPDAAISLGMGCVRNNAVQALEFWTTPEIPEKEVFSSFNSQSRPPSRPVSLLDSRKTSVAPFLSPSTNYRSSFQPPTLQHGRSSIPYLTPNLDSDGDSREESNTAFKSPTRLSTVHLSSSGMSKPRPLPRLQTSVEDPKFNTVSWANGASSDLAPSQAPGLQEKAALETKKEPEVQEKPGGEVVPELVASVKNKKPVTRKAASMSQILRTIWPMLNTKDRSILLFGFAASFVVAVATPAFAFVLAQLISVYYLPTNRSAVAEKWALILIGIAIIDGFATFCSHLALEYAAQQWVNGLRVEAFKRILAQPRAWFDKEKNSADRLSECLDRCAEEMRNLVGRFIGPIFITTWMMSITIVWALVISYKLTLIIMACFPVVYISTRFYDRVTSKWEDRCNQVADIASSVFTETFSNIRVVCALTLESHFKQKHDIAVQKAWKTGIQRAVYSGVLFGISDSLSFFIVAVMFRYASVITTSGQLSLLQMLQVISILLFGISNAVSLFNIMPQINSSRTTGTQMLYLAELPRDHTHETTGTKRIPTPFPVILNELSFTYPNRAEEKTLDNINLRIEAGSCIAIVGPSGSGKSTIASLLLGLYPPNHGPYSSSIAPLTFSGISISELNISSVRNFISIVAQQPLLFPTTIYSNITYGLPEGSPYLNLSAAQEAAENAGIHEFITSLSSGYNTLIGEGGMGISGGQAQRIVIARALIRQPKILILDEATSALDAVSAEAIKDTISRILEKDRLEFSNKEERRAVLVISHDVEMMKVADRVVVLEQGRVVEEGSFQSLARHGKAFRNLIGREMQEGPEDTADNILTPVKPRNKNTWVQLKKKGSSRKRSI